MLSFLDTQEQQEYTENKLRLQYIKASIISSTDVGKYSNTKQFSMKFPKYNFYSFSLIFNDSFLIIISVFCS